MTALAHTRVGQGPPLLLIHGIGSRKEVWEPLLPYLTAHREVVSIDLPGFGASPLRPGQDLSIRGLVASVVDFCTSIDLPRPHVAGNSLGGWIALELGRRDAVASVTGISPAGLWRGRPPKYTKWQVRGLHDLPARLDPVLVPLTRVGPLRMALTANLVGRPWRMPRQVLLADVAAMVGAEGFDAAFAANSRSGFTGGMVIEVPVTVAFGTRDVILGPGCRVRDELPAHTRWLTPRGWGHLPMWDDPAGVAGVILEGSGSTAAARTAVGEI